MGYFFNISISSGGTTKVIPLSVFRGGAIKGIETVFVTTWKNTISKPTNSAGVKSARVIMKQYELGNGGAFKIGNLRKCIAGSSQLSPFNKSGGWYVNVQNWPVFAYSHPVGSGDNVAGISIVIRVLREVGGPRFCTLNLSVTSESVTGNSKFPIKTGPGCISKKSFVSSIDPSQEPGCLRSLNSKCEYGIGCGTGFRSKNTNQTGATTAAKNTPVIISQ